MDSFTIKPLKFVFHSEHETYGRRYDCATLLGSYVIYDHPKKGVILVVPSAVSLIGTASYDCTSVPAAKKFAADHWKSSEMLGQFLTKKK